MITIIHGENTKESRNYFFQIKQAAKNPLTFDGELVTLTDLVQAIQGQGLFFDQKIIFIEELFSQKKQSKELENILEYLNKHYSDNAIIIWESKEITSKQLNSITNTEIKKFDLPKILFAFLDALKPNNAQMTMQLFHKTIETEEPEFVFFMIVRQFRILLALSDISHDPIDEVKRLASWQKGKLQKQMQMFGKEKLIEIYNQLFQIEEGIKTGQLGVPLTQAIDFWLANL